MSGAAVLEKSDIRVLELGSDRCSMASVGLSTEKRTDYRIRPKLHEDLTFKIIGAAMRVHNLLGPGLKEAFYQRALASEFAVVGLASVDEQPVEISVDGTYIGQLYIDHLVEDKVIVETKAVHHLMTNEEVAQVITCICATSKPIGLLINFGRERLEYKRIFPPKHIELWRRRIRRYVWLSPGLRSVNPFPKSVDSQREVSST